MLNRHVTLNTFKTELLIFSHKPVPPAAFSISIDGPDRLSFMQTKNLGGILDYSFSYTSLALPWKFIHKACILCLFTTTLVQLLSSWNKLLTGPPTSTLALLRCILNTATRVTLFKLKSDYVIQNSIVILSQNKSQYPCNGLDGLTWSYRLTSVISSPNTLPPAHSSPDTLVFLLSQTCWVYARSPEGLCSSCSVGMLYWPMSSFPSTLSIQTCSNLTFLETYSL